MPFWGRSKSPENIARNANAWVDSKRSDTLSPPFKTPFLGFSPSTRRARSDALKRAKVAYKDSVNQQAAVEREAAAQREKEREAAMQEERDISEAIRLSLVPKPEPISLDGLIELDTDAAFHYSNKIPLVISSENEPPEKYSEPRAWNQHYEFESGNKVPWREIKSYVDPNVLEEYKEKKKAAEDKRRLSIRAAEDKRLLSMVHNEMELQPYELDHLKVISPEDAARYEEYYARDGISSYAPMYKIKGKKAGTYNRPAMGGGKRSMIYRRSKTHKRRRTRRRN